MSKRLSVPKTYKLFLGGAFPRSESGRTYEVVSRKGEFLANAALASRKDARDAVKAAAGAVKGWSGATAYNRGQVLYRVAEVLEGRRAQFIDEISRQTGASATAAAAEVDEAIDRWVWYAGWCDKFAQVSGGANPVAGPYFDISVPEPTGVVAVVGWHWRGDVGTLVRVQAHRNCTSAIPGRATLSARPAQTKRIAPLFEFRTLTCRADCHLGTPADHAPDQERIPACGVVP
ncbi:MAG: aldehyde dehydrogenase [Microbacterium sp.]|nr:aldehyde dehydrogenase [Microbacterium sp.]